MRPDIREQLILEHLPYVEKITQIFCATHKQKDIGEFQSIAAEELMFSVNNYDNIKGASLKTWIDFNIRNALIDHIIEMWGRTKKEAVWKYKSSELNYEIKLNIIRRIGNIDDYINSLQVSTNGTERNFCNKDLIGKIFQYLDNRPKKCIKSRTDISEILKLYFISGYTMKEISNMKNCTESNISLIIKKSIKDIQKHFVNIN